MEKSTKSQLSYYGAFVIGGFLLAFGTYMSVDSWLIVKQIEAQGLLGQAVYEQQFHSAGEDLRNGLIAVAGAFFFVIVGAAEYIRYTLLTLNGE